MIETSSKNLSTEQTTIMCNVTHMTVIGCGSRRHGQKTMVIICRFVIGSAKHKRRTIQLLWRLFVKYLTANLSCAWFWICCWSEEVVVVWWGISSVLIVWWLIVMICGCWNVDDAKNVRCTEESDWGMIVWVTGWIWCCALSRFVFDDGDTVAMIGRIPAIF